MDNGEQYRNAPDKISSQQMELPNKILEQLAFNTRPMIQEKVPIIMIKSTLEEYLPQPIKTNNN